MSQERLIEAAAEAGLFTEKDTINGKRAAFWQQINETVWRRIFSAQSKTENDGDVSWTQGFEREYELVKKSFMQRLRKVEIDGAIYGPNDQEYIARGKKQPNYLLWGNNKDIAVEDEANKRLTQDASIEMIGKPLSIIRNGVPQPVLTDDTDYAPTQNPIMTLDETITVIKTGIGNTFDRLYRSNLDKDAPGVEELYELAELWKEGIGFATLDENGIVSLDSYKSAPKAWIIIIPPDHKFMQKGSSVLSVDNSHEDLYIFFVKPIACTPEFFSVAGPHELIHLNDKITGKEGRHPSRSEYLDGENRAFSGEIVSADLLTDGEFSKAIKQFVDHRKLTMDDVIQICLDEDRIMDTLGSIVDSHLKLTKPISHAEANMRMGLYFMATAFVVAKNESESAEDEMMLRRNVIETIYDKRGVLPKE